MSYFATMVLNFNMNVLRYEMNVSNYIDDLLWWQNEFSIVKKEISLNTNSNFP